MTQIENGRRSGSYSLASAEALYLIREEHTAQRRIMPRDHWNGAGHNDLVELDECSTDPVAAGHTVLGREQAALPPLRLSLATQGPCKGWMYCRR